jgi:hypothetical protein
MNPDNPGYSGPIATYEEPEVTETDGEYEMSDGRLLGFTVAHVGEDVLWVECWGHDGKEVTPPADVVDAIVQKVLADV